jgi:hypothetical protein
MRVLKKSDFSGVFKGFLLKTTISGRKSCAFQYKTCFSTVSNMRVLKKADFQVISVVFLSKTTISGSKMRFFYHKTCFSTVSNILMLAKVEKWTHLNFKSGHFGAGLK